MGNKEQFCRSRCDAAAKHDKSRCSSVAGELGGRRAADFNLLTNYALNVGTSSLREALQQLESSRACR